MNGYVLEPAAQQFASAAAKPPFVYELGVAEARHVLEDIQAVAIPTPNMDSTWFTVNGDDGHVRIRIVKPVGSTGTGRAVLCPHGGRWIVGSA